ncbi:unnamed protein product [Pleuronectes platessa]|uniref:Uncharacterized protein n=1 Tax=Pleuronectes platessa TaxID=8262 RepID=A0A9N7VEM1_PLEPL|nr:unnamed protein product [Pleuronectes platessa]
MGSKMSSRLWRAGRKWDRDAGAMLGEKTRLLSRVLRVGGYDPDFHVQTPDLQHLQGTGTFTWIQTSLMISWLNTIKSLQPGSRSRAAVRLEERDTRLNVDEAENLKGQQRNAVYSLLPRSLLPAPWNHAAEQFTYGVFMSELDSSRPHSGTFPHSSRAPSWLSGVWLRSALLQSTGLFMTGRLQASVPVTAEARAVQLESGERDAPIRFQSVHPSSFYALSISVMNDSLQQRGQHAATLNPAATLNVDEEDSPAHLPARRERERERERWCLMHPNLKRLLLPVHDSLLGMHEGTGSCADTAHTGESPPHPPTHEATLYLAGTAGKLLGRGADRRRCPPSHPTTTTSKRKVCRFSLSLPEHVRAATGAEMKEKNLIETAKMQGNVMKQQQQQQQWKLYNSFSMFGLHCGVDKVITTASNTSFQSLLHDEASECSSNRVRRAVTHSLLDPLRGAQIPGVWRVVVHGAAGGGGHAEP